jgi:AcrR family transcriptional regulator
MASMTQQRTRYHHGNLPAALAEAAARLAREGGPEAVVLREAARRVGVSPTAAYRHFANHDDLLHAVKDQALATLAGHMEAEIGSGEPLADPVEDALRRFRAIGAGYVRFALAEPGLFRTAFCRTDTPDPPDPSATRPFQILTETLDTLVRLGKIPPDRRPFAEMVAWATVHGLAVLLVDGPLARLLPEDAWGAVIDRAGDTVIEGLTHG